MLIVNVAPEVVPFAKTGGLGDVAGSLPIELQQLGHQVMTFLPRYKTVNLKDYDFTVAADRIAVPLSSSTEEGRVYKYRHPSGAEFYLIDHPGFFDRDELYGTPMGDYPDNDHRFIFFQRAVMETLRILRIKPDVIHCHDWQTGLIPVYIKTLYAKEPVFAKTKTLFTIHNLAYQGNFPPDSLPLTGLGWEEFKMEKLELYGKMSCLKGGIVYSDAITTVSESYSRQIQKEEFGCGLEGVLATRRGQIHGIINGIDYDYWNPETDPDIKAHYTLKSFAAKRENKTALQKADELKLDPEIPIYGFISRLVDQKGIDILIPALEKMVDLDCQFVLLGTGDEKYHSLLRMIGKSNRGRFSVHIVFDPKMAKRIYAGSDFLLVPSYYEPCGLAQLVALRYGTVPVVRSTGGLADTIRDFDHDPVQGNGFSFQDYTSDALVDAVKRSLAVYRNQKKFDTLIKNAMSSNYSWTASAKKYIELYGKICACSGI
ncbi:MAG: glycogen synthase GlgA [Candidatus Omnitrophica bacterium]|nr:glycogen synthase GlgA [Candidatus Omnitrophota bacterium]